MFQGKLLTNNELAERDGWKVGQGMDLDAIWPAE